MRIDVGIEETSYKLNTIVDPSTIMSLSEDRKRNIRNAAKFLALDNYDPAADDTVDDDWYDGNLGYSGPKLATENESEDELGNGSEASLIEEAKLLEADGIGKRNENSANMGAIRVDQQLANGSVDGESSSSSISDSDS